MEGNNKPVDAEFLSLDSACEEHTCPWNFAEGGRDLVPHCAVEKRDWSLDSFRQEGDGVIRCLGSRRTRDMARSNSFRAERRQKASFSVLESSRRAVQKSSSEAKGSWIDLHTGTGVHRVLVRVKGKTFGLLIQNADAWIIPETSAPAPHAVVAPVDEEICRAEQSFLPPAASEAAAAPRPEVAQGMRLEREARDLAADWQSSRQLGQSLGEDSRVAATLKTCETGWRRLAHRCGARRLRCGLESSVQGCTTRAVKRVPDTEQRRADLVKSLQGTSWDRLQAPPVAKPPSAKESQRPSEDADERRSAKAQDLNPPTAPLITISSRSRHRE